MKEFLESIFASSKDRLKNPFVGTFVISWLVYNWNSVLVLFFSNESIEQRITMVKPQSGFWELGFWIPLLIASIYIIGMPYVLVLIDMATDDSFYRRKESNRKRRLEELKASRAIVLEQVKIERLKAESKDVGELNALVEKLKVELEDLGSLYDDVVTERNDLRSKYEDLSEELNVKEQVLVNQQVSPGERKRMYKRFLFAFKVSFKEEIAKITRTILSNRHANTDELSSIFLQSLDASERKLISVSNDYPNIGLDVFDQKVSEIFNLIEDDMEIWIPQIIVTRNNQSNLNKLILEKIFSPFNQLMEGDLPPE